MPITQRIPQNTPVKLHWAGWESDTYRLSQSGWDISVEEEIPTRTIKFALRHRNFHVYGIGYTDILFHKEYSYAPLVPIVDICQMELGREIRFQYNQPLHFHPVDTRPTYLESKIHSMEELCVFQRLPQELEQIIIAPPTFNEILNMALEHQAPGQKELRQKLRQQFKNAEAKAILRIAV